MIASATGETSIAVAARLRTTRETAGKWRKRFIQGRIAGLYDQLRPGAPRTISDEKIAELVNATPKTKPKDGATHWSVRSMAAETGISKTSVHR